MEEIATLRLQTLRMLLKRRSCPLVIVEDTADDAEVEQLAREHHAPLIVVVDHDRHALLGTVSPQPMKVISMLAEEEVCETARRVAEDEVDYVLVAEGNGHLIGVLSADDITAKAA